MTDVASYIGGGCALTAAAFWAVSTTLIKGAITRYGSRAINLFRVLIAVVLFWAATLIWDGSGAIHAISTDAGIVLLVSGVVGLAIGDAFLFEAVRRLGAQPAIAMNQLSPVWSALLGFLLGSEHLRLRDVGGIALVVGGVLLVIFGRERPLDASGAVAPERRGLGVVMGMLSSLCNAGAGMMTRQAIVAVGVLPGSTLRMTGAAAALLLATLATRRWRADSAPLCALPQMRKELVAVFLATFVGIFLQQAAYARLDASIALCLLSTTPLFLLPLAVGILRERYRWIAWLGTLLATAGVPLLISGDAGAAVMGTAVMTARDPHSFARPDEAAVKQLDLDLVVDFERKEISGRATLELAVAAGATEVVLDTRDLTIEQVIVTAPPEAGSAPPTDQLAKFTLGAAQGDFGRALTIPLPVSARSAGNPGSVSVNIQYRTSPGAAALQWLAPEQTAGGKLPFLFTQSQAILARTWIPCQDTPGVRMTYTARVTVRGAGGARLLAVMSAENPQSASADGVYTFRMPQRIPSYLMALAVGDLAFRPLGPRSGVYAEPSVVGSAASEFVDLESMIAAAEKLYGPYRFGRYDVLVLPPSFPFGGMENPRLTFATPTILAGDRSLVSLVAHELAHSWSGNLVTNATWNDFWLNEGFTVYFEHRIMEAVFGKEFDDALAVLGLQDLEKTIAELREAGQERDTWLKLDLAGRNPDDGVTDVAYEKGARFLQTIERAVGRERFDRFLRAWFDGNAFESRTTEQFLAFFEAELVRERPGLAKEVEVAAWVNGPGLPASCPRATSTMLARAEAELARFIAGTAAAKLAVAGFTTQQWQSFLRKLPAAASAAQLADLDATFGLSRRGNSEVLFAWLVQCVAHRWEPAFPALERFLTSQGRRKFLKPLYQ